MARVLLGDRAAEVVGVRGIDEDDVDAPASQRDVELRVGAAVEGGGGDDLVAGTEERRQRDELGGLARGDRQRADPALERGDALLEGGGGGVHDPGVDVAESLEGEEFGGVVGVLEDVRGCLIERHGAGAGGRIGSLPGVDGERVEPKDAIVLGRALQRRVLSFAIGTAWVGVGRVHRLPRARQ